MKKDFLIFIIGILFNLLVNKILFKLILFGLIGLVKYWNFLFIILYLVEW